MRIDKKKFFVTKFPEFNQTLKLLLCPMEPSCTVTISFSLAKTFVKVVSV